jgi:hypothetical protein
MDLKSIWSTGMIQVAIVVTAVAAAIFVASTLPL